MGFWDNHVLKTTKECISDEDAMLRHESAQMWKKLKLALMDHLKACLIILLYGGAVVAVLAMLIGGLGLTVITLDGYNKKVQLEASMQSSDTICMPRSKKE